METLINKIQALHIAHSILTRKKALDDYGFSAKKEAADIISDMIEIERVEQQLIRLEQEPKPVTDN